MVGVVQAAEVQKLANLKTPVSLKVEKKYHRSGESKGRVYTIICRSQE